MRFWEKFSRITFDFISRFSRAQIQVKSIESVLKNAVSLIDPVSLNQLKSYVINLQISEGGFPDRAGKCDVYYSLFGCYVSEALGITETNVALKEYVNKTVRTNTLKGVNLQSAVILYAKLFGPDTFPKQLRESVISDLSQSGNQLPVYSTFLSLLTYYYLKDFKAIHHLIKSIDAIGQPDE
ncbi:MAG: hypothetical protein Q8908_13070, partial [Bacteroidota bacterium]|nr:hypothetical protein [Bacteroidota bacterium]